MDVRTRTANIRGHQTGLRTGTFTLLFLVVTLFFNGPVWGANYRTPNFVVSARTPELAKKVGDTAELCRQQLAILWLGAVIPQWSKPCPVRVEAGRHLGAGGETSFTFAGGEVFDWKMKVQGSEERILDSVIPHEVCHTITATYFRKPVPRWIDEGIATSVEARVEQDNYRRMLVDFLRTGKGIPFNTMVRQKEYPRDQMPFYAQGFSVCEYLILVGGHRRLIEFTRQGLESGNWSGAARDFYGYENLGDLQLKWQNWVSVWFRSGMPEHLPEVERLAEYNPRSTGQLGLLASNHSESDLAPPVTGRLIPLPQPEPLPQAMAVTASSPLSQGVGSARPESGPDSPNVRAPSSGNMADLNYQGTYGLGLIARDSAPPVSVNPEPPRILGQSQAKQ